MIYFLQLLFLLLFCTAVMFAQTATAMSPAHPVKLLAGNCVQHLGSEKLKMLRDRAAIPPHKRVNGKRPIFRS